jgi:hypothetical protein
MRDEECSMPLMGREVHLFARLHRLSVLVAVAIFAAVLAIALGTDRATAATQMIVLGAAAPAQPSCPSECQAIGKTTGFQTSIGKTKSPFTAPYTGKIVAWSIKLGRPTTSGEGGEESQMAFFDKFFGGPPSARISVLKPIQKKIKLGKPIYKLKSQSPVEELAPFLGTTTTFALKEPLRVKMGNVVALTVPTWAPAFAVSQGGATAWQASRKKDKCTKAEDIQLGSAHLTLGAERSYGCVYKTARLLYSATVVKDPNATPPATKPPKKKPSS